ncbi:PAS domain-containing protein [Haloferax larsenii]|uniref:histidine kinase n=1 Tax=Haloferax larsenii TaxID=302484 RepID=A0ABY5RKW6_HALLR|nr:PAS domain-containing protein [Haloferax larsenii]UVE51663.1 PAS domain-containing protein [Haloferax larsenii]
MDGPEQRPPTEDHSPLAVLYVGRDPDFADLVETALERHVDALDVRTETSLIDGISAVETGDFDCIVCEYHLRDGDGLGLLTAVRAQSPTLPCILYAADGDESVASRAISMGVSDYVRRDSGNEDFRLLASRIRNAVDQHRVQSRLVESDSTLAAVYERISDGVFAVDDDWSVVYWNEPLEEQTDISAEEVRGHDLRELFPKARETDIAHALERAMTTQEPQTIETFVDVLDARAEARIYPDEDGLTVCVRDWTDAERLDPEHKAVFSRMTDAFFAVDDEWNLTYFNDRAEALMNRTRDVELGDHLWETFPELVGTEVHEEYLEAMASGEPRTLEFHGMLSDAWYEARLYPSESGLSVYFRDTTEKREAAQELRARHTRLQTLVKNLPVASAVVDADGIVTFSEGKALEPLSITPEIAAGESIFDLYADVPAIVDGMRRALDGEAVNFTVEVEGQTFEAWAEPVFDDDGTVEEAIVVAIDVTDRARLESALRDLQSVARDLLQVETRDEVASVAVDAVEEVVEWPIAAVWYYDDESQSLVPAAESDTARAMVGDAPLFTPDTGLVWDAYDTGEIQVYNRLETETDVFNPDTPFESEVHVPLGEYGVLVAGSSESDSLSDIDVDLLRILSATVSSAIERAEREQSLRDRESELAAANERLDEFVSVVAHDLRNPLSVAKGYLEIALDTHDPAHFEKIETALDRMNLLVDDLLTLARHGSPIAEREAVELRTVVTHAWSFVETNDATLQANGLGVAVGDGSRLLQLFENLFRNAVEHGGSAVEVTVDRLDDGSGFYVEDDGPGISEDEREQVFDHGYTTSSTGTGFGLAIVRDIADAHGWSIHLSESDCGGARFEFSGVGWVQTPSHEQEVQND